MLMAPATLGVAAVQVNVVVNSSFASLISDGALSWLSYAFRLMQLPIGVFGVAVGTTALTHLSRDAARDDWDLAAGDAAPRTADGPVPDRPVDGRPGAARRADHPPHLPARPVLAARDASRRRARSPATPLAWSLTPPSRSSRRRSTRSAARACRSPASVTRRRGRTWSGTSPTFRRFGHVGPGARDVAGGAGELLGAGAGVPERRSTASSRAIWSSPLLRDRRGRRHHGRRRLARLVRALELLAGRGHRDVRRSRPSCPSPSAPPSTSPPPAPSASRRRAACLPFSSLEVARGPFPAAIVSCGMRSRGPRKYCIGE